MQRYSSEAQSETTLFHSNNLSFNQNVPSNNFIAVRKLKQADLQLDLMKRRLSALKIKEEKNNRKSQSALKKLKFHQMIQEMQKRERQRKQIHKAQNELRLQRQKSLNSSQRTYRKEKLTVARQIFQQDRQHHYRAEKQISKSLAERLKALNENESIEKRQLKSRVKQYEEKSKRNYHLYMLQRQSAIKFHKKAESNRMEQLQQRKELQMRNLARLQIQMLQRQSRSRESAQDSVRQLSQVINPLTRSKVVKTKNPEQQQKF